MLFRGGGYSFFIGGGGGGARLCHEIKNGRVYVRFHWNDNLTMVVNSTYI